MSTQSSTTAKPLPKSRVALEVMFKHCDACLQIVDRIRHRNEQKFRLFVDLGNGKISLDELRIRKREIEEVQKRERDNYIPEAEELWTFCDPKIVADMKALFAAGDLSVRGPESSVDFGPEVGDLVVRSGVAMISGQRLHVVILRQLRDSIVAALEKKCADTGADLEAFLAKIAPRNARVADLFMKLARETGHGETEGQIALEFTNGDRKQAESLLRGVRRYRERLSEWDA